MVDRDVEDFLDSDDDAFFLEASNHFLDDDSITESMHIPEKNTLQNHSEVNTSLYFKSNDNITSTETQNNVTDTIKVSSGDCEIADKNTVNASKPSRESSADKFSNYSEKSVERCKSALQNTLNESTSLGTNSNAILCSPQMLSNEHAKDTITTSISAVPSTSAENNSSNISYLDKTPTTSDNLSYIDSRFTPGFTPETKKWKCPTPAAFFKMFNGSKEAVTGSSEEMMDMEFENIVSSQFTPEHLSSISWQKLQTAVCSCPNLHSTVKYYSIQRVLQESSKKKLPKHMVVPFLCVLLKKLRYKGPSTICVFMDDTGEINGKIDVGVLSTYKEYLVEGSTLILNKVTFLCNVLILKAENIVSVYHPDGIEKHPQSLNSILKTSKPLEPMNCECLKFVHHSINNDKHKISSHNTPSDHTLGCINHSQNKINNISGQNNTLPAAYNNSTPKIHKPNVCYSQNKPNIILNQNKAVSNVNSYASPRISETSSHIKSVKTDAFLENLFDEDNCIDEFDELLGNLDEKSFMEDL